MTLEVLWAVLGSAAAAAALPGSIELFVLTLGAALPVRQTPGRKPGAIHKLAVAIPAHNEALQIASTVRSVLQAKLDGIDLTTVVIADNCTDDTASLAGAAGARALVRFNDKQRGKGYALDYAFQVLTPEGYDGFLIVDADTEVGVEAIQEVVRALENGADAVQCRYLVRNSGASPRTRLMSVALMAFNVLRPRGRDRWGLSAGINGNGFALSAATLRAVPYGAASLVEDLEYHLDLVRAGRRVWFADSAEVRGDMPASGKGVSTQRTRWEGGRFRMLAERAPALAAEVLRGRLTLMEPLGDLLLLPLAFHTTLLLVTAAIPFSPSRALSLAGLAILALHLVIAVLVGRGGWREVAALASAPFYVAWKLMLLPAVLASSRAKTAWVRTERAGEEKEESE